MNRVSEYVKQTPWVDGTPEAVLRDKAQQAFCDIVGEKSCTKKPKIYRLAGQSGTGKTTQLLPTVLEYERLRGNSPVVVAVRMFAKYHPDFEQISKHDDWREKTNGFSLKCLTATLELLIESGYMIVLDMTILHPDFERFVFDLLQEHDYITQYHIMAVNPRISDGLIKKRANAIGGAEGGRVVQKESADYFCEILPVGLEYLSNADKIAKCFVWTVFDKNPIYFGELAGVMEPFEKGCEMTGEFVFLEDELRRAKIEYLSSFSCQPVP